MRKQLCSIDGCPRTVHAEGLCHPHYFAAHPEALPARLPPEFIGPRPRLPCQRIGCTRMEARDELCRVHWVLSNLHGRIRRDIAERLPIEMLDEAMMAELKTHLPAYDWRWVCRVSGRDLDPKPSSR